MPAEEALTQVVHAAPSVLENGSLKPSTVPEVLVSVRTMEIASHPLVEGEICSVGNSPTSEAARQRASFPSVPSAKEMAAAEAAKARLYGNALGSGEDKLVLPSGPEPVVVEVEYLDRSQVLAVSDDLQVAVDATMEGLQSKDWTEGISALNKLRQLSIHHTSTIEPRIQEIVPLVLKHVKSLRSSVCKTALLCLSDLFCDLGNSLLPFLDVGGVAQPASSLLGQLLLKASSNDKRFVIDEAERCLRELCGELSPSELHAKMLPYVQHRNPKVRGNAGACVASLLQQLSGDELNSSSGGLGGHLKAAGQLVTDKTPQAREAARSIIKIVHAAFDESTADSQAAAGCLPVSNGEIAEADSVSNESTLSPWEIFCRAQLGNTVALAVLKVSA